MLIYENDLCSLNLISTFLNLKFILQSSNLLILYNNTVSSILLLIYSLINEALLLLVIKICWLRII